ncbi:MAG: ribosome small subunit-dependent GTPase A, partial [Coprobacillus sp.]
KFRKDEQVPLVGDYCEFTIENGNEGYIRKLFDRKNELVRPPICNIDQALLVFSAKEPDMNTILLNRFLILIEHFHIEPVICISKMDLNKDNEIQNTMLPYEEAGYKVIYVSSKDNIGIEEIKKMFKDKITVVTGQSGVGKSSLLNAMNIHLNIDTNEISKALGRGKHTTRHVELLKMYNGYVEDTPGFSSLELNLEPIDIAHSYHDFDELSAECKFRGCLHDSEPHCAIKQAVEDGHISKERYDHYLMFLKEAKELKERKYG